MPMLAMHLTGNSSCLRGTIQDHHGPFVIFVKYISNAGLVCVDKTARAHRLA